MSKVIVLTSCSTDTDSAGEGIAVVIDLSLRRWLLRLHLFIGIIIVHLDSQSTNGIFGLFRRSQYDRCDILHPSCPVAIDKLSHVIRLDVWILQVEICRLCRALIRVPICRCPPWFRARVCMLEGHHAQRQVDTCTLTTFEEAIVLEVNFEHVFDLEDLSHPGRANIRENTVLIVVIVHLFHPQTLVLTHHSCG